MKQKRIFYTENDIISQKDKKRFINFGGIHEYNSLFRGK